MDPLVAKVMTGKRLHTLQILARKIGHQDSTLVDEMKSGFDVLGFMPYSGVFDRQVVAPSASIHEVRRLSTTNNMAPNVQV